MINRRAWSAAAAAVLAMGTWGAALPVHAADETPDALIKRVSTDVLETIKKDPSLREGDVSKVNALVNDKVFLGTTFGELVCLSARSGEVLWTANIGEPIMFQPTVAKGRVYVATNSGSLYCLETGDVKDDGWLMWGANAAHNGLPK